VNASARALVVVIAIAAPFFGGACMRKKEAKVEHVFVGPTAVCVELAGGEVRCAGKSARLGLQGPGFQTVPSLRGAHGIAFGDESASTADRACVLRENGDVVCTRAGAKTPDEPLRVNAKAVALSSRGLCVLHKTGEVSCEENGKLALLSGVYSVKQLAAAGGTTCFLKDEGVAFCWGDNASGELGTPGPKDVPTALFFRAEP
jgi:hypothetical protein